jgi:hypothetical protein
VEAATKFHDDPGILAQRDCLSEMEQSARVGGGWS